MAPRGRRRPLTRTPHAPPPRTLTGRGSPASRRPRRGDAVLELGAALAELAGAPSLARVNSRSLGERIAKRVSGRSWEHPHGRVTIERDGETAGSAAYRARLDAYDRAPAPLPRDPGVDPDDAGPWRHPDDDPPQQPQQPRGRGESADDAARDAWSVS